MTQRVWLTVSWILCMVACLILVELYFRRTVGGLAFVFPEQRPEMFKPIVALYGGHLGAILIAWFVRPFKALRKRKNAKTLFVIAVVCTLIWNLSVLYLVGQRHIWPEQSGTVVDDLQVAVLFGSVFSFLLAPINFYYFGIKMGATPSGA